MAMLIDPPSPFAPEADWREFLEQMEALASELSRDAALVRSYVKMAKHELAIPLDDQRFKCPECKQKSGVNIIYGYPTDEATQQAERNEVALGGCMQEIGAPDRQCLSCGHQWQIQRKRTDTTANR